MSSDWAASALKWWEDAGVDTFVAEEPRDWLKPRAVADAPAAAEPARDEMPTTLAAFQDWLASSPHLPHAASGVPRVPPAGDAASGLMVLVDMPAQEDIAAGHLLAGEAGDLFDKMIGAIGRSRETLYLASLSPVRTPTGTLDAASARALAEIARHHVGLVRPKALLLFGDICSKALIGPAVAGARGRWHELETPSGPVRAIATIRPEKLRLQPNLKRFAWEDLQMLKEGFSG